MDSARFIMRASLAQCGLARNSAVYRELAYTGANISRASIIFSYQPAAASSSEHSRWYEARPQMGAGASPISRRSG